MADVNMKMSDMPGPLSYSNWIKSIAHPGDFANDILGGAGGSEKQTQLAKDVTAQSTANAQAIYEQALAQAAALQGQAPPATIQAAYAAAERLNPSAYTTSTQTDAAATNAAPSMIRYSADQATAYDSTDQQRQAAVTQARNVAPASVASVDTGVRAANLGGAAQAGDVTVGGTTLDPLANAVRDAQLQAARNIANAPSAADSQFKAAQQQVVSDQLAMAAQARGAERAGLRRAAIVAAGQQGSAAALSAAALAAKEEQDKRVAAASALSGLRSQDVEVASTQGSLDSQRRVLQAQLDLQIKQGNVAQANIIRQKQAELELEAQKASLSGSLSQQSTQASLEQANLAARQQTEQTNASAANKAAQDYAAALNAAANQSAASKTAVSTSNAAASTGASKDYATSVNTAGQQYASAQTQAAQANADRALKQAQDNATRQLAAATSNQATNTDVSKTNAASTMAVQGANVNNTLTAQKQQADAINNALSTGTNATAIGSKNAQTITDANKSGSAADAQKQAGLIGAGGSILGAVLSDERVKSDIKGVPDRELFKLADHVKAVTYEKPSQYQDGANRAGELAQELERSALGKRLVSKGADGMRHVDYMGLAGLMAAAAASSIRKREGRAHA